MPGDHLEAFGQRLVRMLEDSGTWRFATIDDPLEAAAFILLIGTIAMAVAMHNYLHLPPVLGMMTGLGVLKVYGYLIRRHELKFPNAQIRGPETLDLGEYAAYVKPRYKTFNIFISMKRAEWDTLMFFYGVVLCVGGLGTMGYLAHASEWLYQGMGPTMSPLIKPAPR